HPHNIQSLPTRRSPDLTRTPSSKAISITRNCSPELVRCLPRCHLTRRKQPICRRVRIPYAPLCSAWLGSARSTVRYGSTASKPPDRQRTRLHSSHVKIS